MTQIDAAPVDGPGDGPSREADANRVVTFGCRLNAYESEVIARLGAAAGRDDLVVVNTCAVTAEAERQARQAIRRLRRENPESEIVVTGCAAQIHPEAFAAMPEVDRVIGNREKMEAGSFARGANDPVRVSDIMELRETASHLLSGFEGRSRAFVQVQNGCDHRCTFCIIPYGRGNSRSVPVGAVVDQVRALVAGGYNEAVLTGVDLTSYGAGLPGRPRLGQLVRRLLSAVPELNRVRLSSIDPAEIDEDLWRLIADEPRLMPHLHFSMQAGSDMILKRMRRRHSRMQAIEVCARARRLRPDIVFGADMIAGFPTEDDAMFADSLRLIEDCGLTYLHVFPYSGRDGTPAARMPQVPAPVRRERAARLREAGARAERAFYRSRIGASAELVVESHDDAGFTGRCAHFAPVRVTETDARPALGALASAKIVGASAGGLEARLAEAA